MSAAQTTEKEMRHVVCRSATNGLDALGVLLSDLSDTERHEFFSLLKVFCETRDSAEREDVKRTLVELLAPNGYFNAAESVGVDEWISDGDEWRTAQQTLADKKRRFSEKVNALCESKGWTQTELAKQLGITQPTLSAIMSGQHKPQPNTLRRLAGVFGVSVEELWPPT